MRIRLFGWFLVTVPALTCAQSPLTPADTRHRVELPHLAISVELPVDWISEVKEGVPTYHPPGDPPEAALSIQMIDNTGGSSNLAAQVGDLKAELGRLPEVTYLADEEEDFAGQPGHLLIGRFQGGAGTAEGFLWQIVARGEYFYWIGMTFPPGKWQDGYAVVMDRFNAGFRFTALHGEAAAESDSAVAAFLRDVRQGNLDEAFERTSDTFRQITPGEEFGKFVSGQPVLSTFPWFRVLDNAGTADHRRLAVEFGGGTDEAVPFAFLDTERKGPADWRIGGFYLTEGQRVPPAGEKATRSGFTKVSLRKAGFSGSFPENWIMLPEELPDKGVRIVFRPPGGGLTRSHQGIVVMIGRQQGPLNEGLDDYLSVFSGLPGYERTGNYESELGGLPAAGATFRVENEDDRGLYVTANVVTMLRSPGGAVALIHVTLEAGGFSGEFDSLATPVIEDFRFIE